MMPRGIYPRKKKFPARNLRQLKEIEFTPYKERNLKSRQKTLIHHIIGNIQNQLDLIKDMLDG